MDAGRLSRIERRITRWAPLLGGWLRRRALAELMRQSGPDVARLWAKLVASHSDRKVRGLALQEMARFKDQASIDQICEVWERTRDADVEAVLRAQEWLPAEPVRLRVLVALRLGRMEAAQDRGMESLEGLLEAVGDRDPSVSERARASLANLRIPELRDHVCGRWFETRDPRLEAALIQGKYIAEEPLPVRIFSALKTGQTQLLEGAGVEAVEPLLRASLDADGEVRGSARASLARLKERGAQGAVCRAVIEQDHAAAREAALEAGYVPVETADAALFYLLTEQWQRYETIDFDQRFLRASYEASPQALRCRIAFKVRAAGRGDWAAAIAGGHFERRVTEMSEGEWDAAWCVLREHRKFEELWRLAQAAPPRWSLRFVGLLRKERWLPAGTDQKELLEKLYALDPLFAGRLHGDGFAEPPALGRLTQCQAQLRGPANQINCAGVSAGGEILGGDSDGKLWVWGGGWNAPVERAGHKDWISCVAVSPDGKLAATGGGDAMLRLWSLPEGEPRFSLAGHQQPIRCLGFGPDGGRLVSGSEDGTARIWDAASGQETAVLRGHSDQVSCLAIDQRGRCLATGSYDQNVRLWQWPDGTPLANLSGHKALVTAVAFAPGGQLLATASKDQSVLLWALPAGEKLSRLKGHKDDISCLAIHPRGDLLATGSWDSTIRLWDLPSGEQRAVLGSVGTMDGHRGWVTSVAFSPDGGMLASGGVDNQVRLWRMPDGEALSVLEQHEDRISAVVFSASGRFLISGSWDRTLGVWASRLEALQQQPLSVMGPRELDWIEQSLWDQRLEADERAWLEFLRQMIHWRRRHDIAIEEQSKIEVGEFDIEIAG